LGTFFCLPIEFVLHRDDIGASADECAKVLLDFAASRLVSCSIRFNPRFGGGKDAIGFRLEIVNKDKTKYP
jgi:hypothetical protein